MLARLREAKAAAAGPLPPAVDPERLLPLKEVMETEAKLKELVSAGHLVIALMMGSCSHTRPPPPPSCAGASMLGSSTTTG